MQQVQQIRGLLSGLSINELRELNDDVVAHINYRNRIVQSNAMNNLMIGSIAEFTSAKLHKTIRIRILKLNQKTVSGRQINIPDGTDTMQTWKVSPTMLRVVS